MKKINIAIDGYSSCGKSTLAKDVAKELKYIYIDTGAMYRAVTLFAIQNEIYRDELDVVTLIRELPNIQIDFQFNAENQQCDTILNGVHVDEEIRKPYVSAKVSPVSTIPEVRKKLVLLQQQMASEKGVVMDGRDIGTVVLKDAELKIFLTASIEIRTQRRYKELQNKQIEVSVAQVAKNLSERDYIDSHRKVDPLRQAEDAVVLDNSLLNREQQLAQVLKWVNEKIKE